MFAASRRQARFRQAVLGVVDGVLLPAREALEAAREGRGEIREALALHRLRTPVNNFE